jgi:hypothetical protein
VKFFDGKFLSTVESHIDEILLEERPRHRSLLEPTPARLGDSRIQLKGSEKGHVLQTSLMQEYSNWKS